MRMRRLTNDKFEIYKTCLSVKNIDGSRIFKIYMLGFFLQIKQCHSNIAQKLFPSKIRIIFITRIAKKNDVLVSV